MLWRGERGEVVAFNIAHHSGPLGDGEGWMGPLAVRPGLQGKGIGKAVVRAGVDWLRGRGARTIGLETMPRTMDNIGFYSGLGFVPGPLTLTVTLEAESAPDAAPARRPASGARPRRRARRVPRARRRAPPGRDFTREIALTEELALGDTVLVRDAGRRARRLRPLPLGAARGGARARGAAGAQARGRDAGGGAGARRGRVRLRAAERHAPGGLPGAGGLPWLYAELLRRRGRVRWTDLRMTLDGRPEPRAAKGRSCPTGRSSPTLEALRRVALAGLRCPRGESRGDGIDGVEHRRGAPRPPRTTRRCGRDVGRRREPRERTPDGATGRPARDRGRVPPPSRVPRVELDRLHDRATWRRRRGRAQRVTGGRWTAPRPRRRRHPPRIGAAGGTCVAVLPVSTAVTRSIRPALLARAGPTA
jgi:hypothetical protein